MNNKSELLEQFYTKKEVARELVKKAKEELKKYTRISDYIWIEPSAGNGSFFDLLPKKKRIGIDIDSKRKDILKADFLNYQTSTKKNIVIGNPPFGKRAKKAIAFFNHASNFAQWILLILPFQFKKYSVHIKLNPCFKLIYQKDLKRKSFIFKNKEYGVNTCFQIWTNSKKIEKDLKIRTKPVTKHQDFDLFQYNNTKVAEKYFDKKQFKWNFAVHRQGFYNYSSKFETEKELSKKRQYIFIRSKKKKVLEKLKKIDFNLLAKQNTIIPGFGKADLIKAYEQTRN